MVLSIDFVQKELRLGRLHLKGLSGGGHQVGYELNGEKSAKASII